MNRGTLRGFAEGGKGAGSSSVRSLPCGVVMAGFAQTIWPSISTSTGACAAGVLKTIFSASGGRLRLNALVLKQNDTSVRNHRLRITIDGMVILDETFANNTSNTYAWVAVGQVVVGTSSSVMFQPIDASRSILVEYASSTTESDKASIHLNYEVHQ